MTTPTATLISSSVPKNRVSRRYSGVARPVPRRVQDARRGTPARSSPARTGSGRCSSSRTGAAPGRVRPRHRFPSAEPARPDPERRPPPGRSRHPRRVRWASAPSGGRRRARGPARVATAGRSGRPARAAPRACRARRPGPTSSSRISSTPASPVSRWVTSSVARSALGSRSSVAVSRVGGVGVEVLGRLVEHQHREVGEQRPGHHEPLPLPAGEPPAVLADRVSAGRRGAGRPSRARPTSASTAPQLRRARRRARPSARFSAMVVSKTWPSCSHRPTTRRTCSPASRVERHAVERQVARRRRRGTAPAPRPASTSRRRWARRPRRRAPVRARGPRRRGPTRHDRRSGRCSAVAVTVNGPAGRSTGWSGSATGSGASSTSASRRGSAGRAPAVAAAGGRPDHQLRRGQRGQHDHGQQRAVEPAVPGGGDPGHQRPPAGEPAEQHDQRVAGAGGARGGPGLPRQPLVDGAGPGQQVAVGAVGDQVGSAVDEVDDRRRQLAAGLRLPRLAEPGPAGSPAPAPRSRRAAARRASTRPAAGSSQVSRPTVSVPTTSATAYGGSTRSTRSWSRSTSSTSRASRSPLRKAGSPDGASRDSRATTAPRTSASRRSAASCPCTRSA